MNCVPLAGPWTLERCSTGERYPAQVPGCVWSDLLRAKIIPDYSYRDSEGYQQWIAAEDWAWERTFSLSTEDLAGINSAHLCCDGLDTLATVWVNGHQILVADNMFRTWRVEIAALLSVGDNTIRVRCASVLPYLAAKRAERKLFEWNNYLPEYGSRGHVRKMACAFGWDWGPMLPTAGIWRDIRIELQRGARIDDLHIRQEHREGSVKLQCTWHSDRPAKTKLELWFGDTRICERSLEAGCNSASVDVDNPELWWPVDIGTQPLYTLHLEPENGTGCERRIGLRSLALQRERDDAGESFVFVVNGLPVFAKGANWVPQQPLPGTIKDADIAALLDDTVAAHMNMLRVWGGGLYESDAFYDGCDERGILVLQDCTFACGAYPLRDPAFQGQVAAEIADNVKRLRHHPSLALWCGNNELEMGIVKASNNFDWDEYIPFFDERLPAWIRSHDQDTPYWPGSPHSPLGDRQHSGSDGSGDAHHWSVFFGNQPFESQRQWRCRFMSEYGFQSMPALKTIEAFTAPEDRCLNSRILDYHQRSQVGNRVMLSYGADWFPPPRNLDETVWVSQLAQSLCVRYAAEHLRRLQPLSQGCLFWQINDVWPCPSWSSIDSFGRWKVCQYDMARANAPILVSLCEDQNSMQVAVHCSNQRGTAGSFDIRWEICDTDGKALLTGSDSVYLTAQSDRQVCLLDLRAHLGQRHIHDLMVWAWVEEKGAVLSRNMVSVARPKHLSLRDPQIHSEIGHNGSDIYVDISSKSPALWVHLDCAGSDTWWSDNDFHLHPQESRRIYLKRGVDAHNLNANLRIKSLVSLIDLPRSEPLGTPVPGFKQWKKE